MCFGAKQTNKASYTENLASSPTAFFRWWQPPEIESPTLKLNEDVLDRKDIQKKKQGTKRFQVPLAPTGVAGTGLGIPVARKGGTQDKKRSS